jgi:hypothetical protein
MAIPSFRLSTIAQWLWHQLVNLTSCLTPCKMFDCNQLIPFSLVFIGFGGVGFAIDSDSNKGNRKGVRLGKLLQTLKSFTSKKRRKRVG